MKDIWLAGTATYAVVRFLGKSVGALYYLYLFAVVAVEIAVHKIVKFILDQAVFVGGRKGAGGHRYLVRFTHHAQNYIKTTIQNAKNTKRICECGENYLNLCADKVQLPLPMKQYNFDVCADRSTSGSMKYDGLKDLFGRSDLTPLWIADMDFECCPEILDALKQRLEHPVLGYSMVPDDLRNSIAAWLDHRHGLSVEPAHLAFVPGIVRGIGFAVNYFTSPGDKILIQPPVYHPFRLVTEGNGRTVINNPLLLDDNGDYRMNFEELESLMATEKPRMMILCNPHNPGGIQWDEDTLKRVASLAKKYGVIVVSDEIHGDLMLFGKKHIPFASVSDEAAEVSVSFGAPSKTFNIAGLASSWMYVPNPSLRRGFYQWMEVNEFSTPAFPAVIATIAAYRHAEPWLDQMLAYVENNIMEVEDWFSANLPVIKPQRPDSSFLIWLDCRALGLAQKDLVKLFVDGAHLALNDGTMFGTEGEGFMRLNVGHPKAQLIEALESLKLAVEAAGLKQ